MRRHPSPYESHTAFSHGGDQQWPVRMHEYKPKYGTMSVSGGSALSRSMRYAETWLYGSVSARGGVIAYPEPAPCVCKDKGKKSQSQAAVCKKCGGSRRSWGSSSPTTALRGFGTVRLTRPKSRPELPFLDDLKDPYDIMRKSRLATVSSTLRVPSEGRSRAKSNSPPGRRRGKSRSPPRHRSPDTRFRRPLTSGCAKEKIDSSSRKSILECDVNPYELISQYLRNGETDSKYPLDEDELSDNLSENALDEEEALGGWRKSKPQKRVAAKSATVGSRSKKGFLDALRTKWDEQKTTDPLPGGVSIAGQRIRLFNTSDPLPTVTYANEFVSDSDDNEEEEIYDLDKHKAWFSDKNSSSTGDSCGSRNSQIPRISNSPKRPPRKTKSSMETVNRPNPPKPASETNGKNRVNFALDVPTHTNRRSNSLTSSASLEIKSILKKPNSTLNLSESLKPTQKSQSPSNTSSNTGSKPDSSSSSSCNSSEAGSVSRSVTPTVAKVLSSPSLREQLQNRKKKQVQFKVAENRGNLTQAEGSSAMVEEETSPESPERASEVVVTDADSAEVLRLQFFGDNREDAQAINQSAAAQGSMANVLEAGSPGSTDGEATVSSRLHRSLSDRMCSGAETTCKFNDTMRLRLRTGRRDTRDTFTEGGGRLPEKRLLSPGRPRPKEPPPPPPPPAAEGSFPQTDNLLALQSSDSSNHQQNSPVNDSGVVVSSAEDQPPPPPPPPPPRQIFPFTKEEIEKIRNRRPSSLRPRSSSNSPVRHSVDSMSTMEKIFPRRTSLTFPITCVDSKNEGEVPLWHRESSVVSDSFTPLMPLEENVPAMEAFSSVTEVYEALEKNSKESEENNCRIKIKNGGFTEKSIRLIVPSFVNHFESPTDEDTSQNRTVVMVSSSSPTQRLPVTCPNNQPSRKTSIMIVGKENEVDKNVNKTSVVIGEFKSPVKEMGTNKVTINVGGSDYQNIKNKTAINNTLVEIRNEFKSNVIIGPVENKSRTLLILEPIQNTKTENTPKKENTEIVKKSDVEKENVIDSAAQEEMNELVRSQVDPVEAARKNIVPHICGRISQEAKRATHTDDTENGNISKQSDSISETLEKIDGKESVTKDQASTESEETLEDDVFTIKDDTDENSDCYVCAKKLKKGLNGKIDEEDEVRIGLEFDSDENHYEIIRDPIYEEISDTPPPLPLSPPPTSVDIDDSIPTRSIFEGASKYDILNYLETAKERGIVVESEDDSEIRSAEHSRINSLDLSSRISQLSNASDSSEDSCNLIISPPDSGSITSDKVRKSSAEIERNDSGVGSETSKCSRSRWQHLPACQQHSCEDCDQPVETQVTDSGLMFAPLVCRKCAKRRAERREIITEIVETEEKYGRDLRIILEEFYRPMLVAGLLTPEQLSAIFLNVEELLENNTALSEKLRDALEIATDQGDEDFLTVNIGSIFLDAVPSLHAFESYCTRQGAASLLLANLEKEKELLRIFLRVSQMENSVLRRMNLNSFLMVPVQRVTKYPLLLARLYRVTPAHLKSREALRLAQTKIELHLEHINSLAKDISTTKLWRRISIINGRRTSSEIDMINIKLRKVAVDVLEWNHDEVRFAMEGRLLFTQPTDNNWRRGRTIKLSPINALLVTLGKPTEDYQPDSDELLAFPRKNGIRDATLLLLKEKSGRYGLLREPLFLDRCIICCEADIEDYFEVQELATKDSYLFKAEDGEQTRRWFKQLQYHAQGLGAWRKRRNALANIMINGMQLRT